MALVASYSPEVFSGLLGPREQHLRQKETMDLSRLRDVFHEYHMEHTCGLALLHRHYDVSIDEIVVETINSKRSDSAPVKTESCPRVVPHLWRYHNGMWYPTEFLSIEGDHDKLSTAIELSNSVTSKADFLRDAGKVLEELGLHDLFGLQTTHRDLFLRSDPTDTVLELTDVPTRVSSITAIPQDQPQPEYFIDTFFGFACRDPKTCGHALHGRNACGWTACAYGCCSDY